MENFLTDWQNCDYMGCPESLFKAMIMEPSRTLLIVPPFASIKRPALGIHVLQSVARAQGSQVTVLYANLILASILGEAEYEAICDYPFMAFLGEQIMGWFAFEDQIAAPGLDELNAQLAGHASPLSHAQLTTVLHTWRELVLQQVQALAGAQPAAGAWDCIGLSSTFDQTNASLILLRACRTHSPASKLVIGGANCEGSMAEGIARYMPELDHVFSGESELTFAQFLRDPAAFAGQKIIAGSPNNAVNDLPANDYSEFFQQFAQWLPVSTQAAQLEIPYESSRGCWWGQKHHCTFCGLNGQGMGFREKNADKVFQEVMALRGQTTRILMADNIMPRSFFTTLLPQLARAKSGLSLFYEQKANIDLEKVMLLKQAGVDFIQPGIEALHSDLLRLMKKGVSAKQNLALLRYCRAVDIHVNWNLLYGFPGEQEAWYAELLHFMPLLGHLQPPTGLHPINIDRFSPFHFQPEALGFSGLRPNPAYARIFPPHADIEQLAYHFCGQANTATLADSPLLAPLQDAVSQWQTAWHTTPGQIQATPNLALLELAKDQYLLIDSRPGLTQSHVLTRAQAAACLVEHKHRCAATDWALDHGAAIAIDGAIVPLALADAALMLRFEQEAHAHDAPQPTPATTIMLAQV